MMTEEEKKSAYQAAKARVSKAAIGLATAASALTPSVSAAQNSAENIPSEVTHTITADVKNSIEITDIKDTQNLPLFGSEEWLKSQMLEDRTEYDTNIAKHTAELTANLSKQLQTPVDMSNNDNINTFCSNSHIGDFNCAITNFNIQAAPSATEKQPRVSSPKQTINHENILHLKPGDANYIEGSLAAYDVKAKKVYMQDVPLTEKLEENLTKAQDKAGLEYIKGNNAIVKNGVLYHEMTHLNHFKYTGAADLTHPIDIAKFDRLTETTAIAVEYLNAAQQYTFMKEQGITTIEFNGEQKPLESILEPYNGLKETIMEKGFNCNNPQSVRNVVEASSEYWHEKRSNLYAKQHKNAVKTSQKGKNVFELLESDDKGYQKIAQNATRNIYIGNNQSVNLNNCLDLLDTMTNEDAQSLLENEKIINASDLTYGKLKEISTYMDSIGITETNAKSSYLSGNFENITTRTGEYDKTLKNIMVNTNSANNGVITYADNIIEKTDKNGLKSIYSNSPQPAADLIASAETDLKTQMQQERQNHDVELKNQTNTLTQTSQQSNNTSAILSQQIMKQIQQHGR